MALSKHQIKRMHKLTNMVGDLLGEVDGCLLGDAEGAWEGVVVGGAVVGGEVGAIGLDVGALEGLELVVSTVVVELVVATVVVLLFAGGTPMQLS